jgi:hypothetical protein
MNSIDEIRKLESNINDETNAELRKTNLKRIILFYSTNVKSYAKWFEIAQVNKNEENFTTYQIIYRV